MRIFIHDSLSILTGEAAGDIKSAELATNAADTFTNRVTPSTSESRSSNPRRCINDEASAETVISCIGGHGGVSFALLQL